MFMVTRMRDWMRFRIWREMWEIMVNVWICLGGLCLSLKYAGSPPLKEIWRDR